MSHPWPHPQWQLRATGPQLTAFNRTSGTRISFGPTPERLHAPELLDVKLTDVCSVGCAFCYQDSRPDRQHARLEDVAFIAAQAGKAGVFEVALGGGEVSEYPHFFDALHLFSAAGVVPNFTTKRMRWLSRQWADLRGLVGGVAVSVGSAAEIRLLSSLIPATERGEGQLVAQVVMGTVERGELLALMQAAGEAAIRVTLLGFKDVGRGQSFRPLPYGWWLADLPQYTTHTQVSIDTALAAECPAELERLLLPGSYHTEEGRFSAYADAVSMSLAPSSYHTGPAYPFDEQWLTHFAAPGFVQGPSTPPTLGRVRLGFATNSSSSHSLVLLREQVEDEPKEPEQWAKAYAAEYARFIITSLEAKKFYLAANLMVSKEFLFAGLSDEQVEAEIRHLCDLDDNAKLSHQGIDSQSTIWFRINPKGLGPHPHQFKRVKTVLYSPVISVFGKHEDEENDDGFFPVEAVDFTLDSADFVFMFHLPETFEPMPPRPDDLSEPLYLLSLVRGQRFLSLIQKALAAGLSWKEIKRLTLIDEEVEFDSEVFTHLLAKIDLHPPLFLLRKTREWVSDERWLWFCLYTRFDTEILQAIMNNLEEIRKHNLEFSVTLLEYITNARLTSKNPEIAQLLKSMERGEDFIKAIGTDRSGIYNRLDDYIRNV